MALCATRHCLYVPGSKPNLLRVGVITVYSILEAGTFSFLSFFRSFLSNYGTTSQSYGKEKYCQKHGIFGIKARIIMGWLWRECKQFWIHFHTTEKYLVSAFHFNKLFRTSWFTWSEISTVKEDCSWTLLFVPTLIKILTF